MMNQRPLEQERLVTETYCSTYRLSWTAIVAGAIVAVGLSFLLQLFEVGLGFTAYATTTTTTGAKALAFGGYIAMVIAGMIAMFFSGMVAGYIGRPVCKTGCHGALYGFLAWGLALIISIVLLTQTGEFVSYHYRALSNANVSNINSSNAPKLTAAYNKMAASSASEPGTSDEKAAKEMAKAIFLIFLIFFSGALSATFGGYFAVKRCRKEDRLDRLDRTDVEIRR